MVDIYQLYAHQGTLVKILFWILYGSIVGGAFK